MGLREKIRATSPDVFLVSVPSDHRFQGVLDLVNRRAERIDNPGNIKPFEIDHALKAVVNKTANKKQVRISCTAGIPIIEKISPDHIKQNIFDSILFYSDQDKFKKLVFKGLLVAYLLYPIRDSWLGNHIKKLLIENLHYLPDRWLNRINEYQLLKDEAGAYFAKLLLNQGEIKTNEILRSAGLSGLRLYGSVGLSIFEAMSTELGRRLDRVQLLKFFEFVKTNDGVRFSNRVDLFAESLLRPFEKGVAQPDLQYDVQEFLINAFGDPRTSPANWEKVAPSLVAVLRRWLAEGAFDLLMSVVSKTNDTKQWKERSKFWKYYFDNGLILDAWVALGENGVNEANKLISTGELKGTGDFGKIVGARVQRDHSMLILQLSDYILSEWTHSGTVRMYRVTNKYAPKLHLKQYQAGNIRRDWTADYCLTHHQSWKSRMAGVLFYQTGFEPVKDIASKAKAYANAREFTFTCPSCRRSMHAEFRGRFECKSCERSFEK